MRIPLKEGIGVDNQAQRQGDFRGTSKCVFEDLFVSLFFYLFYLFSRVPIIRDGWDFDIFCAVWIQLVIFLIGFTYFFFILYLNKLHYLEINVS